MYLLKFVYTDFLIATLANRWRTLGSHPTATAGSGGDPEGGGMGQLRWFFLSFSGSSQKSAGIHSLGPHQQRRPAYAFSSPSSVAAQG